MHQKINFYDIVAVGTYMNGLNSSLFSFCFFLFFFSTGFSTSALRYYVKMPIYRQIVSWYI
jgi:hypothetical protein